MFCATLRTWFSNSHPPATPPTPRQKQNIQPSAMPSLPQHWQHGLSLFDFFLRCSTSFDFTCLHLTEFHFDWLGLISLVFRWLHLTWSDLKNGLIWHHLTLLDLIRHRQTSFNFSWVHLTLINLIGFFIPRLTSITFTWCHPTSLDVTWLDFTSLDVTWIQLTSLALAWL